MRDFKGALSYNQPVFYFCFGSIILTNAAYIPLRKLGDVSGW